MLLPRKAGKKTLWQPHVASQQVADHPSKPLNTHHVLMRLPAIPAPAEARALATSILPGGLLENSSSAVLHEEITRSTQCLIM